MNLVAVVEQWDPADDTAARWPTEIVRGLAARGRRVSVLAARHCARGADSAAISVVPWPAAPQQRVRRWPAFARWAREQLAQGAWDASISFSAAVAADLVHSCGLGLAEVLAQHPEGEAARAPGLLHALRQAAGRTGVRRSLERQALLHPRLRSVVVLTARAQLHLSRAGVNAVHLIPGVEASPPVDPAWRAALRQRLAVGPAALVVACAMPRPDPAVARPVVGAWDRIVERYPDAVLVLAGTAAYFLHQFAAESGLRERVRLLPSAGGLGGLLEMADLAVVPAAEGACSRTAVLALARGIPTIVSSLDGAAELLSPDGAESAGLVLPQALDSAALADAILALAEPATLAAARQAARSLAPRLALGRHLEALEALLSGSAADAGAAAPAPGSTSPR